ncbi:MAG: tail fiber domain-containing protein [bacterium]
MESTYYESSDLFIQGQTPTAAEWNERVFYLPQAEFNARWQNFSIWLTAPTVTNSGNTIIVNDINAIVGGIHITGNSSIDGSMYGTGDFNVILDSTGTLNVASSVTGNSLSAATFSYDGYNIGNLSAAGIQARLFVPWVEVVNENNDEEVVVWWVNDGRGGIKRDTDGHMMVSDDGTTWERLAGRAVSPLVEDGSTHSIRRVNEDVVGNARGANAIDLAYKRASATQIASADYSAILSGLNQQNDNLKGVIVGGSENCIRNTNMSFPYGEAYYGRSFIGAGYGNYMGPNNRCNFIGGGYGNSIDAGNSCTDSGNNVITGGLLNVMINSNPGNLLYMNTISGGQQNNISGTQHNTISGGLTNVIGGTYGTANFTTIGGGRDNTTSAAAQYGCIPGGRSNNVGDNSFACGTYATALWNSFCFADGTATANTRGNEFKIGAAGGLTLRNNAGTFNWYANGVKWLDTPNGGCYLGSDGVWYSASSREIKHDFQPVDKSDILQKVSETTLEEWRYNATPNAKHIGVVAEDFAEKFGLGDNPEGLNPLDVCGVLWAAVQELTRKVAELEAKLEK